MTDQLNAIRERLERAKLYSVNIDTVVYEFDNECVMLSDWIKSQHADLSKLLRVVEVLSAALDQVQCQCTIPERMSGHRVDCWNLHVPEALTEAEKILNE